MQLIIKCREGFTIMINAMHVVLEVFANYVTILLQVND